MGQKYELLSLDERCTIARYSQAGKTIRQIAAAMDRESSTIARELKRNSGAQVGYRPAAYKYYADAEKNIERGKQRSVQGNDGGHRVDRNLRRFASHQNAFIATAPAVTRTAATYLIGPNRSRRKIAAMTAPKMAQD
jgi:IS30 family transposase